LAQRENAQHSTVPKTDEGKAKSSKNSITPGIFITKFLEGAKPETIAEIEELAASLREHYDAQGVVEEMLVQKIVIETARYGRILALEQPEPGRPRLYSLMCLDRTSRYSTATSRALYKAMKSSNNTRRPGKLAKSLPLQWMRNRPNDLLNSTRGNPRSRARTPLPATALLSKIRKMVSERMRPHRGWRGFTPPARAAEKK
jgi:hypothetical protein